MNYSLIFIIHGVESFGLNLKTVQDFIGKIEGFLPENSRNYFVPQIINWDAITKPRELEALEMEQGLPGWLDKTFIKKKLTSLKHRVGSDILYEYPGKTTTGINWLEQQIQDLFQSTINNLADKYGENSNIILIGHSWGGQKSLRFCFDSVHPITGLITMGSPITAVSGAFQDWGKLPPNLKFWLNFKADGDWIGSQFKHHKSQQLQNFVEDYFISSWNPSKWTSLGAHTSYWSSNDCCKKIADTLVKNFY